MEEASIILKGKALKDFQQLVGQFSNLGFTSIEAGNDKVSLEKAETSDLKGRMHHFYRATFFPDRFVFTYTVGANRKKRDLEALATIMNILKVAEAYYEVDASELHAPLATVLNEARALVDSEHYATAQQLSEWKERYYSLEKKYKDLVLSSEQNARILLECEKKRDEYLARIKELEGMSDDALVQELFKWLKTHGGEMNVSHFAKSYSIPIARAEEGLEYLLKNGYIRKKG